VESQALLLRPKSTGSSKISLKNKPETDDFAMNDYKKTG
jgi:hypothetical protein